MIFRTKLESHFTVLPNAMLNDERLSYAARGLLSRLLSKPNDWEVRLKELVNGSPAGIAAVRSMIKELELCGYMLRVQQNKNGVFGSVITEVYDTPQQETPYTDYPYTVKPHAVNRTLQSKEKKQSKEVVADVASEIGNNIGDGILESFPEMEPEHYQKIKKTKQLVNSWKGLTGCSLPTDEDKRKEDYTGPAIALLKRTGWNVSESFEMLKSKRRQMLAMTPPKTPFRLAAVVPYIFADGDAVGATQTGKEWWE